MEWNHPDNNIVHSASVNSFRTAIISANPPRRITPVNWALRRNHSDSDSEIQTQHSPSTKAECGHLYRWINPPPPPPPKRLHNFFIMQKSHHEKKVSPRVISGNAEEVLDPCLTGNQRSVLSSDIALTCLGLRRTSWTA